MTHKCIVQWLLVISSVLPLAACANDYPSHYSAESIEAKVIDAETKKPIEGVIVTANWQLLGGIEGSYPVGQMQVMETQTGQDGVFRFPAWGPLKRPKGHLRENDPQLLLFKSGYEYRRLGNYMEASWGKLREPLRRSDWNGRTIALKLFRGTEEEYARHLGFFETSLDALLEEECAWKRVPRMILAVSTQSDIFRVKGLYALPSIESLDIRYKKLESKCGSVKEFFRNYKP